MLTICVERLNDNLWKWFEMDSTEVEEIEKFLNGQEWEVVDIEGGSTLYNTLRYMSFEKIKELEDLIQDEQHLQIGLEILENGSVSNLEDALNYEDYMIYNDCKNMSDVAYEIYEQDGQLAELEKVINSSYINWEAIGRDLEIEGTFVELDNNTYLQIF